jgi:SAM-dependent methyltransferase
MISIFTPTHNPQYLLEAYESFRNSRLPLEWIVVPNNECSASDVPEVIASDSRVRIVSPGGSIGTNIGALKHFACAQCRGDVLLELDHDDLLVPEILPKVQDAFDDNPGVVLVHSNWAEVEMPDWTPKTYAPQYGWTWRPFVYGGRYPLQQLEAPPQNAYTASSMYWGPNHLRAFRRSAYERVFGHDPKMAAGDDLDLICRLFLIGDFHHIDECGYIYRRHVANTWKARSAEIHAVVAGIRPKYFRAMVEAEVFRAGEPMLDLGGLVDCPRGYISVDAKPGACRTADLSQRYPFDDSTVAVVRASNFLEHVADKMHSLREIHRILRPGGYLLSDTPSTTGPNGEAGQGADQDPTHVSRWNANCFWYVTNRELAKCIDNTTIRFFPVTLQNWFPSDWQRREFIPYVRADLIAMKDGGRVYGLPKI